MIVFCHNFLSIFFNTEEEQKKCTIFFSDWLLVVKFCFKLNSFMFLNTKRSHTRKHNMLLPLCRDFRKISAKIKCWFIKLYSLLLSSVWKHIRNHRYQRSFHISANIIQFADLFLRSHEGLGFLLTRAPGVHNKTFIFLCCGDH